MRTLLITGSSTGIGLATALHFARKGDRVFASLRNPEGAPELNNAVEAGLPITTVKLDIDSQESVTAAVAGVLEQAGHIDVLVNNAGVGGGGPVEMAPLDRARQTFETNYFGTVRMMQAVLPGMRAQGHGAIVNVTSVAGRVFLPGHGHYAASKAALEAITEITAGEVTRLGIRVAIIEPGVVLTPIFSKHSGGPPPDFGPYETCMRRLWKGFEAQLRVPTLPEAVAGAIEHALDTDQPRLRYGVGGDAEVMLPTRASLSDEEWVRLHSIEEDGAFFDAMQQLYGHDLYRQPLNAAGA